MIQNNYGPRVIKIEELIEATKLDETCIKLKIAIKTNHLEHELKKEFNGVFDELSISNGGLILKGNRIFIPMKLRNQMLNLAHEGHQGIIKTTSLLRNRVWFPSIDKSIINLIKKLSSVRNEYKKKS
jgi:hypothetical protein